MQNGVGARLRWCAMVTLLGSCGGGGGSVDGDADPGDTGVVDGDGSTPDGGVSLTQQWDPAFGYPGVTTGDGSLGAVYAFAVDGNDVYVGGDFTHAAGEPARNILLWNQVSGEWSALGSGTDGPVRAIAASNGTVYAGGDFAAAGGVAASHVARWDGASWSAMGQGMDDAVRALVIDSEGTLYAGGDFANAGGAAADHIASWDGSAWAALGLGANNGTDGPVFALLANGSDIYVGGDFGEVGGVYAAAGVAVYADGMWAPLAGGGLATSSGVRDLSWYGNAPGEILTATGTFLDPSVPYATYELDTQQWTMIPQASLDSARGAAIQGVFAGGVFYRSSGGPARGLHLNDQSFLVLSPSNVLALDENEETLFVGGDLDGRLSLAGGIGGIGRPYPVGGLFRLHYGATTSDTRRVSMLGPGAYGGTRVVEVIDGALYVGGEYIAAGDQPSGCIFRMDLATRTWTDLNGPDADWATTAACNGVAVAGESIYVLRHDSTGEQTFWTRDPNTEAWTRLAIGYGDLIDDIAGDASGRLYVVGSFASFETVPSANMGVVLAGGSWSSLPAIPDLRSIRRVHVADDDTVYVAAQLELNAVSVYRVYRLDGDAWTVIPGDFNNGITAIETRDGVLYVAGSFSHVDSQQVNHIAAWDGAGWEPLGTGVTVDQAVATVSSITISAAGNLYAAGNFTRAGDATTEGFAVWDGTAWEDIPGPTNPPPPLFMAAAADGEVFAIGSVVTPVLDPGGVAMVGMGRWVE